MPTARPIGMKPVPRTRPRPGRWPALAVVAALAGCSSSQRGELPKASTYEVKGKVVLGDGKPLSGGKVVFVALEPPALSATGDIAADGTFALSTLAPNDGAVPGEYKVRIEPDPAQVQGKKGIKGLKYPLKYTDEDASNLRVTVRPESNALEPFRLK